MTVGVCTGKNGSLYDQFHTNAKGASTLHKASGAYDTLAAEYLQHQTDLKKALEGIRTTYTGTAADQMQGAFDPLIKSMDDGHQLAVAASKSMTDQSGHFDTAQKKIVNTVPVPGEPWYEHMVPWNTDHDDAVDQNNDINSANNAAFAEYGKSTMANDLPQFTDTNVYNSGNIAVASGQQVNPGYNGGGGGGGLGGGGGGGGFGGGYHPGPVPHGGAAPSWGPNGPNGPVPHGGPGGGNWPQGGGPGGFTGTQGASTGTYPPGGLTGAPGGYPSADGTASPYGGNSFGPVGGFGGASAYGGGAGGGRYGGATGAGSAPGARGAGGTASGAAAAAETEAARAGAARGPAGAAGASGMGGAMGGRGGKKEEDGEHKSAAYLVNEENANDIVGELPPTVPPVIGG
ncbi:MAG: hypothetical protein JOZ47_07475 [Kutzneria sp.]|nr:hypothetical protein [Kutzneria sp.]MBV9844898.1 hypothetical protein [Kutzneria sp.]